MGIFAWLDKQFPYDRKEKAQLFDELEKTLADSPKPSEGISEPVISLIESLGRDEWELVSTGYVSYGGSSCLLVNVFHESLKVHLFRRAGELFSDRRDEDAILGAEWMTEREKLAVAKAAVPRSIWLSDLNTRMRNQKMRDKYMILVKDNNEQP